MAGAPGQRVTGVAGGMAFVNSRASAGGARDGPLPGRDREEGSCCQSCAGLVKSGPPQNDQRIVRIFLDIGVPQDHPPPPNLPRSAR